MSSLNGVVNAPSFAVLDKSQPHTFISPLKKINEGHDVPAFLTSRAYGDIMTFLLQLNHAMFPVYTLTLDQKRKGFQIFEQGSANVTLTGTVTSLRCLIEELGRILDDVPPDTGPRRFGNASFKKWYQLVEERTSKLLEQYLPAEVLSFTSASEASARDELESYFLGSFGSAQRLDYGSGHELSFLAFLGCIWKLGGFDTSNPDNEARAIVLAVFSAYLSLIRRLIKTYTLEPAGSHGVWGLDDHSFIPYIFGSAQLGPPISPGDQTPTEGSRDNAPDPADVAKIAAVERQREKNMYFDAIGFIHDVKKGPFWEHSPMLYDISGVQAGWGKINKGMIKMYNAEVLSKFPVVQHFRFGSLFCWDQDPNAKAPPTSVHASSQPIREGMCSNLSLENASARTTHAPGEGTKAPWASKPASTDGFVPGVGTAAPWAKGLSPGGGTGLPPGRGAAAPWANKPTVTGGTGLPPSRFPGAAAREAKPVSERTQMRSKPGAEGSEASMPPPTRAPWSK